LYGKFVVESDYNQLADYTSAKKKIPYMIVQEFVGKDLVGIQYEQLMPYTLTC